MSYLTESDILDLIGFEPKFNLSDDTLTVDLSPKTQLIGVVDIEVSDTDGYDEFEDIVVEEFFNSIEWLQFLYKNQGLDVKNIEHSTFDDALKPITGEDTVYELESLLRIRIKDAFISRFESIFE